MTSRKAKDIIKAFNKKGFVEKEYGDHYYFVYYTVANQKTIIKTKLSRGSNHNEIGDSLLNPMAKQCFLDKKDFINLVDCPLSREEYEKKLKNKKVL
ncbi:MAG: hypothetical protein Ta2D_06660 [Rickettsiales bacterium]|nr:MAG: hypothetical protein Ta2D_06660 [Rickettsiales bacterium]